MPRKNKEPEFAVGKLHRVVVAFFMNGEDVKPFIEKVKQHKYFTQSSYWFAEKVVHRRIERKIEEDAEEENY